MKTLLTMNYRELLYKFSIIMIAAIAISCFSSCKKKDPKPIDDPQLNTTPTPVPTGTYNLGSVYINAVEYCNGKENKDVKGAIIKLYQNQKAITKDSVYLQFTLDEKFSLYYFKGGIRYYKDTVVFHTVSTYTSSFSTCSGQVRKHTGGFMLIKGAATPTTNISFY
jgi:hypothetical protein